MLIRIGVQEDWWRYWFRRSMPSTDHCSKKWGLGCRSSVFGAAAGAVLMLAVGFGASCYAQAQQPVAPANLSPRHDVAQAAPDQLPKNPRPRSAKSADPKQNGALYGTVMDPNGALVAGAKVELSGTVSRSAISDSDGGFSFTGLPAGTYSLNVTGSGMKLVQVPGIELRTGGVRFLPPVVLAVAAASTSIKVFANPEMLAEEQLNLQIHQRVLGVLPNYYTSFDWNAVHLWPKQKLKIGYRSSIDPITFVIVAGQAGMEQMAGRYSGYGRGVEGYAKRYGADYATNVSGKIIGDVVLASIFRQDPRYFYKGTGSFGSRATYAISRSLICRGDNGNSELDYSRIMGDIASGAIANSYYPDPNRGVTLVFTKAAVDLAANAATNLIREFILPGLTSHVPSNIKEKAPIQIHF